MTVIMINCVTLGMYQPCEDSGFCDRKCQILKVTLKTEKNSFTSIDFGGMHWIKIRDVSYYLPGVANNDAKVIDDVIYLYFLGEMIIKMIAMGVMGRGCYLQVVQ